MLSRDWKLLSKYSVLLALGVALSGCGQDEGGESSSAEEVSADAFSDTVESDVFEDAQGDVFEADATPDISDADATPDIFEADATPDISEEPPESLLDEKLTAQFEKLVEEEGYPTIMVGVVDGDAAQVYGFGELDSGEAPDGKTLYEIGSVTKTFTALMLANAVVSEQVSLADPVQNLLPDFEIPTRNAKSITLETLATHHSGLPRMPAGVGDLDVADYSAEDLRSFLANYTLPRDPGASYEYSNVGYGFLGHVMGEVAGVGYAAALQAEILEPLGLTSTYSNLQDAPAERLAKGHNTRGNPAANLEFDVLAGAGAIISDTDDLLTYLRANMGLIDSSLYPAMQLAHQARAGGRTGPDETGLGWKSNSFNGVDVIWHGGRTGGYTTFVGFLADGSRGLVIMTNITKPVDTIGLSALLEGSSSDDGSIDMTPEALEEYVGRYKLNAQLTMNVYLDGAQLMTQATGQGAVAIFPSAIDEFFAKVMPVSITFERDEAQQVAGLTLHQNGTDYYAPRLPGE